MREYRIETTQFEFLSILSLTIEKEINNHACTVISGVISDDNADEYQRKLMDDVWVELSVIDMDENRETIFVGIVAGFTLDCISVEKTLTLKIMSGTWLMDRCVHFRTFQNGALSYVQVMKAINEGYTDSGVIWIDAAENAICGLLLQYLETDWEFLKRISSQIGSYVTPAEIHSGAKYYVGGQSRKAVIMPSGIPYSARKHVGDFMRNSSSGLGSFSELDYLEFIFQSRDLYELWDQVTLDSYTGYIYKIHSEYSGSELVHTYSLRSELGMSFITAFNQKHIGCSFMAIVEEVKQDVVRVEVIGDENESQTDTIWFPYSTVYSTPNGPGWYCMPEVGDHVRLHVPSELESDAYVISAVHMGDSPDRQNPDHKSIKTIYGKELLMTPDLIRMTNNQGVAIEIDDNVGIRIISEKDIQIQAASNITINSEDASLLMAGTQTVDITQRGASIHIDDDISFTGAKFRIH